MKFKSLAIQGFKSFADKTLLEFPEGITAIVGPNGSGKSNVMDALRWVFGEQKVSELRGQDMEDVIFAGSEKRRAAGFAQVSLTLEDISSEIAGKWGALSEIAVSRKIYRSGEREYYINGRRCRLKDIRELFLDTGVGARSISIIEQERVTRIVNSTPEELRYFLEETAGIVRYKERRKEAETRLRQTTENLLRIKDILAVLVSDIEHLAVQVKTVETYKELRKRKESLEKLILCVRYGGYVKEKTRWSQALSAAREHISGFVSEMNRLTERELSTLKEQDVFRETLKSLRSAHEETASRLSAIDNELTRLLAEADAADRQRAQAEADLLAAQERREALEEEMQDAEERLKEAGEQVGILREEGHELQRELNELRQEATELSRELKQTSSAYYAVMGRLTEVNNRISLKQAEEANNTARRNRLEKDSLSLKEELHAAEERAGMFQEEAQSAALSLAALTEELQEAEKLLKNEEAVLSASRGRFAELSASLKAARESVRFIEGEIAGKSTGGSAGKEFISKFSGRAYKEIHPGEGAYILYSDLFVFDDVHKYALLQAAQEVPFSFRFIFSSQLGQIQNADALVKVADGLYLQGAIYRRTGSDDTGFVLMELERRLTGLQENIAEIEKALSEEEVTIKESGGRADEFRHKTTTAGEALRSTEIRLNAANSNFSHAQAEKSRILRNIETVGKELAALVVQGAESTKILSALELEKKELEEKRQIENIERSELEKAIKNCETSAEDKKEQYNRLNLELARYAERTGSYKDRLARGKEEAVKTDSTIHMLQQRITGLKSSSADNRQSRQEDSRRQKKELTVSSLALSERITAAERQRTDKENELAEIRQEINRANEKLREHDRQVVSHEAKYEGICADMRRLEIRMREEYNEELAAVWNNSASGKSDVKKLVAEAAEVSSEMETLGPLNMAAESEYAEKLARSEKEMKQMADIEASVANLNALIADMDESTVQLFADTFKAVRENFTSVFTKFFGSGQADLVLTDPDNLLVSGVELKVNPPGKKISNKNLLSGGEKALAALTLLFALFLQKPTPFCFLDEVDAPLDDANAARFISMLDLMSDGTQFVIITHKHQTMAAAHSLYGITMQEAGVSTVLSVALN